MKRAHSRPFEKFYHCKRKTPGGKPEGNLLLNVSTKTGVGVGETVMTYTATGNGQIGERGLYSDISSYDANTDGDKLITASALNATFTNLPTTPTTKLECANSPACTLWTIVDQTAYGNELPTGYTRLQYIESTGTQYINTGIIATNTTGIKVKFNKATASDEVVVGALGDNVNNFYINLAGSTMYLPFAQNYSEANTGNYTLNTDYIISVNYMNDRKKYVNDVLFQNITKTLVPKDLPMAIFAGARLYGDGQPAWFFNGKIYYVIITSGDILVRNFIPAKNPNNVIGMYDTVSGQFFTNAATSGPDFTAGPPVQ